MKRIVRLNESDIRRMVREALDEINAVTANAAARGRDAQLRGERRLSPATLRRMSQNEDFLRKQRNYDGKEAERRFNTGGFRGNDDKFVPTETDGVTGLFQNNSRYKSNEICLNNYPYDIDASHLCFNTPNYRGLYHIGYNKFNKYDGCGKGFSDLDYERMNKAREMSGLPRFKNKESFGKGRDYKESEEDRVDEWCRLRRRSRR